MSTTKIEFAVQMTCNSCVDAVRRSLAGDPGVKSVDINLETGSVVVDTLLPTLEVQKKLESSGRKVAVRGFAGSSAAVAMLDTGHAQGVVRFVQVHPNSCIIDGTVDGLQPSTNHRLSIHECGDISNGCDSVGDIFNPTNSTPGRSYGDLGLVQVAPDGRAEFRFEDHVVNLSDVIGRSLVITEDGDRKIACGIIARSAGLFENPKTICACDGLTIWNEKINPKAVL